VVGGFGHRCSCFSRRLTWHSRACTLASSMVMRSKGAEESVGVKESACKSAFTIADAIESPFPHIILVLNNNSQ